MNVNELFLFLILFQVYSGCRKDSLGTKRAESAKILSDTCQLILFTCNVSLKILYLATRTFSRMSLTAIARKSQKIYILDGMSYQLLVIHLNNPQRNFLDSFTFLHTCSYLKFKMNDQFLAIMLNSICVIDFFKISDLITLTFQKTCFSKTI